MTRAPSRHRLAPRRLAPLGTALAGALLPLALGVLFAKAMAVDPLTPVNALITNGGRPRVSPAQLRGGVRGGVRVPGGGRLRRCRTRGAAPRPAHTATTEAEDPVPAASAAGT